MLRASKAASYRVEISVLINLEYILCCIVMAKLKLHELSTEFEMKYNYKKMSNVDIGKKKEEQRHILRYASLRGQ